MNELNSSISDLAEMAAPGREPWVVTLDLTAVNRFGTEAIHSKRQVDNETLSVASGTDWNVIFDGMLHNHAQLTAQLLPDETMPSGAQLVGAAFQQWGDNFLARLEGMFAILILDNTRKRFLAIRDRLGFQPLFYASTEQAVFFSDSIIRLRRDPRLSSSLNRPALADYLCRRFPDEGETFFTEIRRILPAGKMEITLSSHHHTFTRYWEPSPPGFPDDSMTSGDLDQFDWLLEQAVRRSLNFGKSGVFLSGGLDSVSVGAVAVDLCAREGWPKPWALSIAFPHPEANEEHVQRSVAAVLGIPQIMLPFYEAAGREGLHWAGMQLNLELAAPMNNPWLPVYWRLAQQAKDKDINVILTGGGGDDWLTVNTDYMADLLGRRDLVSSYRFARSAMDSYQLPRLAMLRFMVWDSGMRLLLARKVRQIGRKLSPGKLRDFRYRRLVRAKSTPDWIADDSQLRQQLDLRIEKSISQELERPEPEGSYGFYNYSAASYTFTHPLNSLTQEEDFEIGRRLGLRLMHPYWDDQLVQFMCKVPPRLLLQGGREKGLVRQSVARRFPTLGFERQKKVLAGSFFVNRVQEEDPAVWQRIGGAEALAGLGIVKESAIEDVMRASLTSDSIFNSFRAWELLNLESWVRAHM